MQLRWTLALLALSGTAIGQKITYGPILGRGATPDQMIVKWGTQVQGDPTSVSFRVKGMQNFTTVNGAAARDHEMVLTGLALDTIYEYHVTSGAAQSATLPFTTCPAPGAPMNVVFYGDSRSDEAAHARVVAGVLVHAPEMVFESGDIQSIGSYSGYLAEFFPVAKDLVATTPFMAAPGNHDAASTLSSNYGLVFPSPRQQPNDPWRAYYSFTCGNAQFIALDSNSVGDQTQKAFLTGRLAAAKADPTIDHVFVWFHHSAYSVGDHGDSSSVKQSWVPLFKDPAHKVTAVFSGHDHVYNRLSDGSPVIYVVSGGAGAGLYGVSGQSAAMSIVAKSTYNFVNLHIAGGLVTGTAWDDAGNQIDTFLVMKASSAPDAGTPADLFTNPPPPDAGTGALVDGQSDPPDASGGTTPGGCSIDRSPRRRPLALPALALLVVALVARRRRSH